MKPPLQKPMSATGNALLCASLASLFALASANAWADPQGRIAAADAIVVKATNSFTNGEIPTLPYNAAVSVLGNLPTIIIQEQSAGALRAMAGGSLISLALDDMLRFDPTAVPTVAISKADGTALTGRISSPEGNHFGSVENSIAQGKRTFDIRLLLASDANTGPYTITISGLRIWSVVTSTGQGSPLGDYSVTVTGNSNRQPGGVLSAADLADGSNVGARPAKQSVPVAKVANSGPINSVTVRGPITAQTIKATFAPSEADAGRQGSVFILGYMPPHVALAPNTFWTLDGNRNWNLFTGCSTAVAYYSGAIQRIPDIPIVAEPADLTALIGSELYVGYGLGGYIEPNGTACNDMLQTMNYFKILDVK